MNKKIIFLIGGPGSGKDTQVKLLGEKTGFYTFTTSAESMAYINAHMDDPQTAEQKKRFDEGELFEPEWLIEKVQKSRTREILEGDWGGIIFAGSPRTLYEARELPKILAEIVSDENIITLVVEVSEEELEKRSKERLVCSNNEIHVYSTKLDDLKEGDSCPQCDGVLGPRGLDSKTKERIAIYNETTLPGIEFMKENGRKVVYVNGEQDVEDVHKNIMEELSDFI